MTRHLELPDTNREEAAVVEPLFRKTMKRVNKLARGMAESYAPTTSKGFDVEAGREIARQTLIIELVEWLNSELDGEIIIVLYDDGSKR